MSREDEIFHSAIPEWLANDEKTIKEKEKVERFIIANLAMGRPIEKICAAIIHPATGLPPTPTQLEYSFPKAFVEDIATMNVTTSMYEMALYGDKGERIKAATEWLKTQDGVRWQDPAKRIELTGKDGNAIEIQNNVNAAIMAVTQVMDSLATRKKAMKKIDAVKVEPQDDEEDVLDIEIPDMPEVTYSHNK